MEWRTAFVGREREIAEVRSLLEGTRLLTLTGPGGIGKTRLATEALRAASDQRSRQVTVELASVREADQLLPAIGAALGLRESSAIDAMHVLSERLGRRKTLLLLDNFEQIASAGPTVGALLDATSSLKVMVTSRVTLHLSGEQVYPVPPLTTPPPGASASLDELRAVESVRLFVERARSVRPDFDLSNENAAAIGEVCRQLDGLPLAIELAASRLKVLSPDAILKRLGQRLALLTGGAADAPARQRTLRATIEWSYELLPAGERALLSRCAVFSGGFGLDGARAVVPDQAESALLEALGLLVDHNLMTAAVGSEGEPRFGILETIREFGLGELSQHAGTEVRDRHADFCIQLAESADARLQGFEHAQWLARLNEEIDNIRAARAWLSDRNDAERLSRLAAAMATYFRYYGSINEGRGWLAEAVERSQAIAIESRAAVLMNAGWLDAVGGDVVQGRDLLEQALMLYDEIGDPIHAADTLYHLGSTLIDLDESDLSAARLARGLAIARREGDTGLEGRLLYALAELSGRRQWDRLAERTKLILESIQASKRAGDMQRVALSLGQYGWVAWDGGDRQLAIERWSEGVRLHREWGERSFLGSVLLIRSFGERELGRLEDSRQSLLEALQLTREAGAMPDVVSCLAEVGMWLHAVGADDRARAVRISADEVSMHHGIPAELAWPLPKLRTELGDGGTPGSESVSVEDALDAAERDLETTAITESAAGHARRSPFELTPREREVLELVVAGRTNAEIGEALFISGKTASVHVANIKDKLAADSRIGIVTIALDRGLVGGARVAEAGS